MLSKEEAAKKHREHVEPVVKRCETWIDAALARGDRTVAVGTISDEVRIAIATLYEKGRWSMTWRRVPVTDYYDNECGQGWEVTLS